MRTGHTDKTDSELSVKLHTSGFRFTSQRQQVYDVLVEERDHPTAEGVFLRAKKVSPDISMATVYNCLDTLVKSGLIRMVRVQRGAVRFCPNMAEHWHFYCDRCDGVFDIDAGQTTAQSAMKLPRGFQADHFEVAIHGVCPDCGQKKR